MDFFRSFSVLVISLCVLGPAFASEDVDPANDGSQYAYAANLGWINAEPQGDGGPGILYGVSELRGWLWSANTGWISLSCENTSSCGAVEYRVSHDGSGNLRGYGWSPNIGWVSFSCSNTSSCGSVNYSVTINTGSGEMGGYAYAANTGWIGFSCSNTASCGTVDFGVRIDTENTVPELIFENGFEGS